MNDFEKGKGFYEYAKKIQDEKLKIQLKKEVDDELALVEMAIANHNTHVATLKNEILMQAVVEKSINQNEVLNDIHHKVSKITNTFEGDNKPKPTKKLTKKEQFEADAKANAEIRKANLLKKHRSKG